MDKDRRLVVSWLRLLLCIPVLLILESVTGHHRTAVAEGPLCVSNDYHPKINTPSPIVWLAGNAQPIGAVVNCAVEDYAYNTNVAPIYNPYYGCRFGSVRVTYGDWYYKDIAWIEPYQRIGQNGNPCDASVQVKCRIKSLQGITIVDPRCNNDFDYVFIGVIVNRRQVPDSDIWLVRHAVTHELGHVFGMGHESGLGLCKSVMCNEGGFSFTPWLSCSDTLTDRDIEHVNRLWN